MKSTTHLIHQHELCWPRNLAPMLAVPSPPFLTDQTQATPHTSSGWSFSAAYGYHSPWPPAPAGAVAFWTPLATTVQPAPSPGSSAAVRGRWNEQPLASVGKPEPESPPTPESMTSTSATPTNKMTAGSRSLPMASHSGMEPNWPWTPPLSHPSLEMASPDAEQEGSQEPPYRMPAEAKKEPTQTSSTTNAAAWSCLP